MLSPSLDPRTPVVIGAAQVLQRAGSWSDPADALGPIELMVAAARDAAADAGSAGLAAAAQWIGVAGGWWRYADPGRLVAAELGAARARTALTSISGSAPQELLGLAADRIARGELDVALVLGGEARWSHRRISRAGEEVSWIVDDEGAPPGESLAALPPEAMEEAKWFQGAPPAYALFEVARRAAVGESIDEHRTRIARLWHGYNTVAVDNPYAWIRDSMTVEEIRDESADNRMIAWPYPKAMVANNTVDMASGLLVTSVAAASAAGVAADRWVFPHIVTKSHDSWLVAERAALHRTPGASAAGLAAMAHAAVGPDELGPIDLYACFPSSVEMTCDGLGISMDRPLTVTGGLGFAGAPVGNAVGQSLAAMMHRLRAEPGARGLVQGNGGNATKHSFGIYATTPPSRPYVLRDCQPDIDLGERPAGPARWEGPVVIEAYTVVYDREGPTQGRLAAQAMSAGGPVGRVFGHTDDPAVMASLMADDHVGTTWHRRSDGTLHPA